LCNWYPFLGRSGRLFGVLYAGRLNGGSSSSSSDKVRSMTSDFRFWARPDDGADGAGAAVVSRDGKGGVRSDKDEGVLGVSVFRPVMRKSVISTKSSLSSSSSPPAAPFWPLFAPIDQAPLGSIVT
jgi:hypothetical protein